MSVLGTVANAMQAMISRAKVTGAQRGPRILVSVQLLRNEAKQNIELFLPYGYSAIPLPGGDVIAASVGGVRDQLVALHVDDPARRIRDLAPGELGLSNGSGTQSVIRTGGHEITTTGSVRITADGAISITAPAINAGSLGGTLLTLVTQAFQALYNNHTHSGGAVPDQQMTAAHLTSALKAD